MKFADLPPADRWATLDQKLPGMIETLAKACQIDPSEELLVSDLAKRHGVRESAMVTRLRDHGGLPYRLGIKWFIRARSYAVVLASLEKEQNEPASSKR